MKPSKLSLLRALPYAALLALLVSAPAVTAAAQETPPAGDAPGELRVAAPATQDFSTLGLFTLPAGASVTLEFDVVVNGSIPAGVTAVANQGSVAFDQAGAPLPTDDPTTGTADDATVTQLLVEAELGVTKSDNPASATTVPGTSIQYDVVVSNAGPFGVLDVPVTDTFPAALGNCAWSCGGTGNCDAANGVGNVNTTVDLEAGQSVTFVITCDVDPAATGSLVNTATATAPAGVSDPGNTANSDSDTNTLTPAGNLTISKVTNTSPVVPGGAIQYEITVSNSGPSDAVGVDVDDTFPAAVTGVTWSCAAAGGAACPNANGAGDLAETVSLPAGGSLTYTVDGTVDAGASGSIVNTATLTVPAGFTDTTDDDAVAGSESDTVTDNLDPEGDVAVTKTTLTSPVVAGGTVEYEIEVTNTGPSDALGVTLTDTVPGTVSGVTWTCVASGAGSACSAASGNGDLNETLDVGAGGSVTYTVTGTVDADATGDLVNTASVTPPAGFTDGSTGNDDATVTDALAAEGNLSVDKTTLTSPVVAGLPVQYQVVVSNSGPSTASGAQVQDNFSTDLSNESWTCSATAGSSCTAAGNGDVLDAVTLLPGGAVTYTVTADLAAGATSPLNNTATVTAPAGFTDTDDSDDSDTVSNAVALQADLILVKDDGGGPVEDEIVYTITVTNAGPGDATGVTVTDVFPAGLSAVEWTCVGSGGATCTAGPVSGDINDSADLPANSMVVYTATATIDTTEAITNTASASAPAGVVDPNPDDNEDSVTTSFAVILEIPTLSQIGLALLVLLLAGLGLARLRRRGAVVGLALLLALAGAGAADAQVLIDDFSTAQGPNADPPGGPPPASSTADTAGADIVGGERDLEMRRISGGGTVIGEVTGGQLDFVAPPGTRGEATLTWDGNDSDATALDPVGLGGVDLTGGGGLSGFLLTIDQASTGVELILRVYTDGSNHSQAGRLISTAINSATPVFIPFGELQAVAGAGADPANVGAVVLVVRGLNATLLLDRVDTVGPNLVITKVDLDPNTNTELGATQVQAGSTIRYRIQLQNQGGDATTVDVNDVVGANTTLVSNTLNSTPVAVGDAYRWFGNVTLVANGVGLPTLLGNDTDPDGDPITVTAIDVSSARGGGVTLDNAATGAFTYVPPAGVRGIDTFGYSIQDDDGNVSTAVATVQLEQTVWFVDSTNCGPPPCGTGTQSDPFGSLVEAQNASAAGDVIRLRQGADDTEELARHNVGIQLKSGQRLIGEGVDLILSGIHVEGLGTADGNLDANAANRPRITHGGGGNGLTLADNVEVLGLDVVGSDDSGVFGSSVDAPTVNHAAVIDSGGAALELLNSTNLSLTFTGLDSLNSTEDGVLLDTVTGSLTVTGTTQLDDPVQSGIQIVNSPGFTATFGAVNVVDAGDAGAHAAVHLASNAGATLTFGILNLDSENGDGLFASSGGTVNHPSSGNVVNAVGGAAVDIQSTAGNAGGSSGWSFDTLASTNSPDHGVRLVSLSDDFTVNSGGTTVTDADVVGILVQNSGAGTAYDFGDTTVTDTNVGAGATADGVDLATGNGTATFTFDSLDVVTDAGFGLLANNSGTISIGGTDGNQVVATGGAALNVTGTGIGAPGWTFDTLSSSSSSGTGVNLVGLTGSITGEAGSITGSAGTAFNVDGGAPTVTYSGSVTQNNAQRVVNVEDTTGGSVSFDTGTVTGGASSLGVRINNADGNASFADLNLGTSGSRMTNQALTLSGGSTGTFSFADTQIFTNGAMGINANNGGVVQVTGSGNVVDASNATAMSFLGGTTFGALGVTFQQVSSNNTSNAIVLNGTGAAGVFEITGDSPTNTDASGGVLDNLTADAVVLNAVDGGAIFRNLQVTDVGNTAVAVSNHDAFDATMVTGLTLDNVDVNRVSDNAVRGSNILGLTVMNSSFDNANRYNLAGVADTTDEGTLFLRDVGGTTLIDNNTFVNGAEHVDVVNSTLDLDMTLTRNLVGNTWKQTAGSAAGKIGVDLIVEQTANATIVIGDGNETDGSLANTFLDNATASLRIAHFDESATGTINAIVSRNNFTVVTRHPTNPPDDPQGGVILRPIGTGAGGAVFNGIVSHNTLTEVANADGRLGAITLFFDSVDPGGGFVPGANSQVRVNNNNLVRPVNRPFEVVAEAVPQATALIENNTITTGSITFGGGFGTLAVPFSESFFQARNGATLDLVVENHAFPTPSFSGTAAFDSESAQTSDLCLALADNSSGNGYRLQQFNTATFTLEQGASAVNTPVATVIANNSNTGSPVTTTGTITVTGPQNAQVCARPTGGIFSP